ncbi:MAG: signal peptidase I [Acholeplasmatales bacterium]|nr:signal peptidase I [Acholeplasmatales bacterium]
MDLEKEDYGKNLIYTKRLVLNRYIYNIIFFFSMVLTNLICIRRIKVFIEMYQSFTSLFKIFGLEFYFICLIILIIYLVSIITYIIIKEIKNEEWLYKVIYISDKLDIFTFITKCVSVILFIMIFFFNPCTVSGLSMYDTFDNNDKIICSNYCYIPERGDVVTFDASDYTDNVFYIKRIVAKGGDTILYVDNTFYVNGKAEKRQGVDLNQFNNLVDGLTFNVKKNGYVIPKNKLVLMGDNRNNSMDSRYFGLVDKNDIFGKVILRISPIKDFKMFF